jgi:3-oxoadipate enol-lactonase
MTTFVTPWLPPGHTAMLPGRGEVFYRHFRHPDPDAPTLLLLHGWTASADLQFFSAYEALAEVASFVAIDHRGHGRGLRHPDSFELSDVADDAAALLRQLGVGPVITVGYSMGGPVSMLFAHAHPDLVRAVIVQATALEWRATWWERMQWKTVRIMGPLLRSWAFPLWMRVGIRRLLGVNHPNVHLVPWIVQEMRRNDAFAMVQAGHSLSRYDARPFANVLQDHHQGPRGAAAQTARRGRSARRLRGGAGRRPPEPLDVAAPVCPGHGAARRDDGRLHGAGGHPVGRLSRLVAERRSAVRECAATDRPRCVTACRRGALSASVRRCRRGGWRCRAAPR